MTASAKRVVVTARSFGSGSSDVLGRLERAGLEVVRASADHDPLLLRDPLAKACAWIAGTGPVTVEHLALAPHLSVLARYGVGVDSVDLDAAACAGVLVANTPGANSDAVAEHAIALLLAALRSVPAGDRRVRSGTWTVSRGRQLAGTTAGVVGFGLIGRRVAARLAALGCSVVVHDPGVDDEAIAAMGHRPLPLQSLCSEADVVSLHAPGGTVIVDEDWLAHARAGQVVVNTARADLVDEQVVCAGLSSGTFFAYAADTLATEAGHAGSPLLAEEFADRVVLTPHLGAQTIEAVDSMGTMAVDAVLAVLSGGTPQHVVSAGPQ
ncbi:MAG: 2-hydroxyacid dehydrogenase [Marmoricola sp.]|nr:2-hydroxyacid dehydrogenase [Marmoricola sp.]MCW2838201.1 2-hydroxyacid dehydrogenase [Marmoricola sp.]